MNSKQVLTSFLQEKLPNATYISSTLVLNSANNFYQVKYKLDDVEDYTVIPFHLVDAILQAEKDRLAKIELCTVAVLTEFLLSNVENATYQEHVLENEVYTIYYTISKRSHNLSLELSNFNVLFQAYEIEAASKQLIIDNRELNIKNVLTNLLTEEVEGCKFLSYEIFTDHFSKNYKVWYIEDFDTMARVEEFILFDSETVESLLDNVNDIVLPVEEESDDIVLTDDAKQYMNIEDPEPETNLPPRILPYRGKPGARPKHDKIFDNDWNKVEMDFTSSVEVDETFNAKYFSTDAEYFDYKKINEDIYEIVNANPNLTYLINDKQKISKKEIDKLFLEIRKYLEGKYPEVFIFSNVADFLEVNYTVLYEKLPSKLKEILVRELDEKYDILKKKGLKKIF